MAGALIFSEGQLESALKNVLKNFTALAPGDGSSMAAQAEGLQALVGSCYLYVFQGRELESSLRDYRSELDSAPAGSREAQSFAKAVEGLSKEIKGARQKSKILATAIHGALVLGLRRVDAIDDTQYGYMTQYMPDPSDDAWGELIGGWGEDDPRYLVSCPMTYV